MFASIIDRRQFFRTGAAGLGFAAFGANAAAGEQPAGKTASTPPRGKPTQFQIACMTLPYSAFPLDRALSGLKAAGYKFIAWGTNHREMGGKSAPLLAGDAPADRAKDLA